MQLSFPSKASHVRLSTLEGEGGDVGARSRLLMDSEVVEVLLLLLKKRS